MPVSPKKPFYRDVVWWVWVVITIVVIYKVLTLDVDKINTVKLDAATQRQQGR